MLIHTQGGLGVFNPEPAGGIVFDLSPTGLRLSAEGIAKTLAPKSVDVYEPGRLDPKIPIEQVMATLVTLRDEGLFDNIGLSEVSAKTLAKAAAIAPIATVEIEVSPMAWEEETRKVLALAAQDDVKAAVLAYSPMGRGALSGKTYEEIPVHVREMFPRFHKENWEENKKMVEKMAVMAEKKGVSIGQLCLAWVQATCEPKDVS